VQANSKGFPAGNGRSGNDKPLLAAALEFAEGSAGSGLEPADEPREHRRILIVLVTEMVAIHGL